MSKLTVMMSTLDFLPPAAILPSLKSATKKQLLQDVALHAAGLSGLAERDVFDLLLQRERLGSTGIGNGIAIPHNKFAGLSRLLGIFARLEKPIDYDSLDGQPVDLIFVLLAPEEAGADHLRALARIARVLRDPGLTRQLRETWDSDALFALLTQPPSSRAA
jgi:nitrogen PTS system EIIA component